ncbi:uncharacterized protein [Littorina saxatilis]|uniref:Uncharacterized protein n=1 Tax=Littorina saxatilis TaxID=31220 RepID=A0AAN9G760_9CAEN
MKLVILIVAFVSQWMEVNSQSVAQQCLTEQIRNNNLLNNQQQVSPEGATLSAFQSICQNYPEYIQCFQTRLRGSNDLSDAFLSLLFDPRAMTVAYRGLCQDLDVIQRNIQCLLSTPQVRRCYDNFNQGVQQVIGLENQGQLPRVTLEEIACNVSVSRYQCETAVYRFCDQHAGRVMQDFFFAGVPAECRRITRVRSRYADLWGGADSVRASTSLYFVTAALMMIGLSRFV